MVPGRPAPSVLRLGVALSVGLPRVPIVGSRQVPALPLPQPPRGVSDEQDSGGTPTPPPSNTCTQNHDNWDSEDRDFNVDDDDASDSGSEDDEDDVSGDEIDSEGCAEDDAIGDGIGAEGGEEDGEIEQDITDAFTTPQAEQPAPPQPQWLIDFLDWCSKESKKRVNGVPLLYLAKKFWFDEEAPYFRLQSATLTPQLLYKPRAFLWDPIVFERIGCPYCSKPVIRHGEAPSRRRVVDLNGHFFIIGFRYRCPHCTHPVSGQIGTVTFNSWDQRILKMLRPELAAEFPARLTRRSGVSLQVMELMRSCFQNGMGGKGFADCIRVQHLLRHDHLQRQYYNALVPRLEIEKWTTKKYQPFHPYDDTSPLGPHGYVPGSSYFMSLYDEMILEHKKDILKHTAMLPLNVASRDHSYKVCPSYFATAVS